jgi:guanylate kinase
MNLVCFCGPHAAGKGEVAKSVFQFFGEGILERVVPCTTRPPRPCELHGREYYFISEEKFGAHVLAEEFAWWTQIRSDQRSGTLKTELFNRRRALVDILPSGARTMRDVLQSEGKGEALLIFIHASQEERRQRILARDPGAVTKLDAMMRHDPVDSDLDHYLDFDFIIENPDGKFEDSVSAAIGMIRKFLRT